MALNEKTPLLSGPPLDTVDGSAQPGQLLAILGGSGAGKSTLLNVLTRRNLGNLRVDGQVRLNGALADAVAVRRLSAYVQQDDLFVGTLTVREHLHLHVIAAALVCVTLHGRVQALLRMGGASAVQRRRRVHDVIREVSVERGLRVFERVLQLGLRNCEKTLIGTPTQSKSLSGGERKRLSFASEVLTDPPLMFCDEPTSGLDAFMALQVVGVLKQMARRGKTVLCTIHQPSSQVFAQFDRILLMAEGRVAFLGPNKAALALFQSVGLACPSNFNPADHYIRTLAVVPRREHDCKARIQARCPSPLPNFPLVALQTVCNAFKATLSPATVQPNDTTDTIPTVENKRASWVRQFGGLFWRAALGNLRDPALLRLRLYQTIIISLLTGLVFWQTPLNSLTIRNINGVLFQLVLNMTFMFVFAVVDTFCVELPVVMREYQNGLYRTDTYFISKMLAELPQYVILPFLFTSILYWLSGAPLVQRTRVEPSFAGLYAHVGVYVVCVAICVVTANVAISIGYLVSCCTADLNLALSVTPVVIIPCMLFGGFFLNEKSIPSYFIWLKYVSYFKYSYEALAVNEWRNIPMIPGCSNKTCPATGMEVLEFYGFSTSQFQIVVDIGILVAMGFLLRLLAYSALFSRARLKT